MEEAQGGEAASVLDLEHQAAPAPKGHLGRPDGGFKDHGLALAYGGEGCDPGAIFVAEGQVKEGVLKGAEPKARESLRHLRPHPLQGGEGIPEPCHGAGPAP